MSSSLVSDWFCESFGELHPQLQQLHKIGGILAGKVHVKSARGFAGYFGRAIAKKFSIPIDAQQQLFSVTITHQSDGLHWDRTFNARQMKSVFLPVGNKPGGYWLETTGDVQLYLTVDVKDGGWYWRCLSVKYKGITFPLWLFPRVNAYKKIENEKYSFYVGFNLPVLGEVLSYGGLLELRMPQ
ncbi:hypothetical protein GCM10011613_26890 [Cellvibrio zantedeschiae]|uniref:DUF4166 domain-containing protein n=1 Tax=Cellvibrio zantedeschiae TaxID=1237077 RepID=A0ABQ3B9P6_9GAMM|nr:DUF4166 domain-containing protein [Cellvibrio zantedeschiae]GGY80483.1 hypothetical protein GCM10011613_26890 [Cellvibrio zantedeschiae]